MSGLTTAAVALFFCGCAGAIYQMAISETGLLQRAFAAYCAQLDAHTNFLLTKHSGSAFGRIQLVALVVCAALWAATQHVAVVLLAALVALLPPALLRKLHRERVARLEQQLDTWLLMLASALRSTPSLGEAIASTAVLIPAPFSEEVDLLLKEVKLGVPLHRALHALSTRARSMVVSGAIMAIIIARQTGGDLPAMLERTASALRESARLEGVLRAKTSEGRGQVLVLAMVPFVLCFVIASLDPTWFDPMLASQFGRVVIATCAVAWTVATTWAYQIAGTEL